MEHLFDYVAVSKVGVKQMLEGVFYFMFQS